MNFPSDMSNLLFGVPTEFLISITMYFISRISIWFLKKFFFCHGALCFSCGFFPFCNVFVLNMLILYSLSDCFCSSSILWEVGGGGGEFLLTLAHDGFVPSVFCHFFYFELISCGACLFL